MARRERLILCVCAPSGGSARHGVLLVACLLLYRVAALHPTPHGEVIASLWQEGELAQRVVLASPGA